MAWRVLQSRARRSRRTEPRPLRRRHGGGALAIRGLREATTKSCASLPLARTVMEIAEASNSLLGPGSLY